MKREQLKEFELSDEQIDKIMSINGKDIEKHKSDIEAAQAELKTITDQLTEANKTIEGFKALKVEDIQQSADEYKAKFEQAQKDAAAQVASLKFDHALDGALTGAKAKNAKAVKALLEMDNLKLNEADGSIIGLDDQLTKIKESNDYLFEDSEPTPRIVTGANNNTQIRGDAVVNAARKAAGLPDPK